MFATLLNIQELSQIGEPNFQKLEIQFRCQCVYSFILPIFLIVRSQDLSVSKVIFLQAAVEIWALF